MSEFGATSYLVKKSKSIKKELGILGECAKNKCKAISHILQNMIVDYYERDENSRMCPGKKEKVGVQNLDGEKEYHQKRLVLCNLKEPFSNFKKENPGIKIGFSSFAALRPKWYVLAGSSGTHSVCVCTYRQNPKLMIDASLKNLNIHELMVKCVCKIENEDCMMGNCSDCPCKDGCVEFLQSHDDLNEVRYQQWVSVDRTEHVTLVDTRDSYIVKLAQKIDDLTRHSFIAKTQSAYMNVLKECLIPETEIFMQGDFAENFSFVVQDKIQSFHWENSQATLHPFVAYYRHNDGTLENLNMIISDWKVHNSVSVHAFLEAALDLVKNKFPTAKKVHYFTDSCGCQYKNRYNFMNLCRHESDFGLQAEWNFFAMSHGKSACSGLGGTVKRLVTKASLQRPTHDQILTPQSMFSYCTSNISDIQFLFVDNEKITLTEGKLKHRMAAARGIPSTRQFHRFVPISLSSMNVYKYSLQAEQPLLV